MKVQCPTHGVHFPDEFKQALTCKFWESKGGEKLPRKAKKQLWDWQFSFPFDEFGIKFKHTLEVMWRLIPYTGNDFEGSNPKYKKLPEKDKKALQKDWMKFVTRISTEDYNKIMWNAFSKGSKKWRKKL